MCEDSGGNVSISLHVISWGDKKNDFQDNSPVKEDYTEQSKSEITCADVAYLNVVLVLTLLPLFLIYQTRQES